jgi:hypothetical protein
VAMEEVERGAESRRGGSRGVLSSQVPATADTATGVTYDPCYAF